MQDAQRILYWLNCEWTLQADIFLQHTHTHSSDVNLLRASLMHRYAHAQIHTDTVIYKYIYIYTHTNSPTGGGWRWDRSKWLMWVFVTGSLRQCGEQLSSLTGVASTPPSPPPHPNTNTQAACWEARSAHGEIGWGVLAIYMCLCIVIASQHVCVRMYVCVCVSVFSSGK